MSNDKPVKGFRKLGGVKQSAPADPEQSSDGQSDQFPAQEPSAPFSAPPPPQSPPDQLSGQSMLPQQTAPSNDSQIPGNSQMPNPPPPPPPPPWQQSRPQPAGKIQPQSTSSGQQQQSNPYQYQPQMGPDPNTAFIIELIGGLFGFFGIGYMYAGKTNEGVGRLVAGIVCNVVVAFSAVLTSGICACIAIPAYVGIAIVSAGAVTNMLLQQYH